MASAMPEHFVPLADKDSRHRLLTVITKIYSGKEDEKLVFWIREIEVGTTSSTISAVYKRVLWAVFKLRGRAREWTLECGTSVNPFSFSTWGRLNYSLPMSFGAPNQAYRVCLRFLSTL